MHLVELQNHGEVKELKRSISEVVALHTKLEQKSGSKGGRNHKVTTAMSRSYRYGKPFDP